MGPRPSVVLADDHAEMLRGVADLLRSRFDIVAAVGDGRMALDAAAMFNPDLAVLDIAMPELDGIRTARELRRRGSRARIVFLTLHQDDGYVSAALASGALGYVLKSRLQSDLVQAMDLALAGYRFVSPHAFTTGIETKISVSAARLSLDEAKHAIQFHPDDASLLAAWTDFLGDALEDGAIAIIVATRAHEARLAQQLRERNSNVSEAMELGRYIPLDVDRVLSSVMADGRLDESRLAQVFEGVIKQASTANEHRQVALAGEISPILLADGKFEAAIKAEQLGNEWVRTGPYSILCSYPTECFHRKHHREFLMKVCAAHTAVVPSRN